MEPSSAPSGGFEQRSLNRTAFEVGTDGELFELYLPREDPDTVYIGGVYTTPWMQTLRDIAAFDGTARIALNALALTVLGRARSDPALLQESTRQYAKALRDTNNALQDNVKAQSDAVLACCKILAL